MKRSTERILTTHVGSLPRPLDLQALIRAQQYGQPYDQNVLSERVQEAVIEVVRQQTEAGVGIISDGEQGKTGFLLYGNQRLTGFESVPPKPGESGRAPRRDQLAFPDFYEEYWKTEGDGGPRRQPVCTGPITYQGQAAVQRDIENFKLALSRVKWRRHPYPRLRLGPSAGVKTSSTQVKRNSSLPSPRP